MACVLTCPRHTAHSLPSSHLTNADFSSSPQEHKSNRKDIGMETPTEKQRRHDLEVVVRYVKEDLFANVKFIYDPKLDLAVGGRIYQDHKTKCCSQLGTDLQTTAHRDLHLKGVWTDALTKHTQKNALAQKRSAVHTVMQNKFSGESVFSFFTAGMFIRCRSHSLNSDLCHVCVDRNCVMLSLESVERRLDDPKACYVFYQYFYKAAVGEVRWKEFVEKSEGRIGNNTTEAFALLLFANNYKAWMHEEKLKHGDALSTECDQDSGGKTSIVDTLLGEQEFVLEEDAEIAGSLVVCDTADASYKLAGDRREEWLANFKARPICVEMVRSWAASAHGTTGNEENETGELLPNKRSRDKKRRRIMKGYKKWTGTADDGERKFKGWSDNGHKAFERHAQVIKADVEGGRCARWEKAYRMITAMHREARLDEVEPSMLKCSANRSVVWEL